jgi:hypothetical protein
MSEAAEVKLEKLKTVLAKLEQDFSECRKILRGEKPSAKP